MPNFEENTHLFACNPNQFIHLPQAEMDLKFTPNNSYIAKLQTYIQNTMKNPEGSISSWRQLRNSFVEKFWAHRVIPKTDEDLMVIRMWRTENVTQFAKKILDDLQPDRRRH